MADIEPVPHGMPPFSAASLVRQNAIHALIAAALMLYFGYPPGGWNQYADDPEFLPIIQWIFDYTLIGGGVIMVVTGILLFTGKVFALVVDAVASGVIGILLIGCGAVFAISGYQDGFLYLIFGVFFGAAARSAWANYQTCRRMARGPDRNVTDQIGSSTANGPPDGA